MKFIDEFRDGRLARGLAAALAREAQPQRDYAFMEFCGGHTHAISRYGVTDLLPGNLRMVHGPGCPVCVLPIGRIDMAIELALNHRAIVCSYGDTLRVPASDGLSLMKARSMVERGGGDIDYPPRSLRLLPPRGAHVALGRPGGDIRMVYSPADALKVAQENPEREVVFFAIGFETTTPPTAVVIKQAAALGLRNFSVLCCHVLTPPAMHHILATRQPSDIAIDGFVGPAHVSTVIGSKPYEVFATDYRKPVVIAGFEPLDVMQAILMLLRQVNDGRAEIENEFTRAVTREGNPKAQALVAEVLELRPEFEWRGLGVMAKSALAIRQEYAEYDAERRFALAYRVVPDNKACECGAILRGVKRPQDCAIFGTVCTPENPIGSCMVSSEGACAAHYTYGRYKA